MASENKYPEKISGGCLCEAIRYEIHFSGHYQWPPKVSDASPTPLKPLPNARSCSQQSPNTCLFGKSQSRSSKTESTSPLSSTLLLTSPVVYLSMYYVSQVDFFPLATIPHSSSRAADSATSTSPIDFCRIYRV